MYNVQLYSIALKITLGINAVTDDSVRTALDSI